MNETDIWNQCFSLSWEAFRNGSIPIGCVIIDATGEIVAFGRNATFELNSFVLPGKISHAEMNALYSFNKASFSKKYRESCVLYSTMEPCSMCLGATVSSDIRKIYYAAKDTYAGAISERLIPSYISKRITFSNSAPHLYGEMQIVMQTVYLLEKSSQNRIKKNDCLDLWYNEYPQAVKLGNQFFVSGELRHICNEGCSFEDAANMILDSLKEAI